MQGIAPKELYLNFSLNKKQKAWGPKKTSYTVALACSLKMCLNIPCNLYAVYK